MSLYRRAEELRVAFLDAMKKAVVLDDDDEPRWEGFGSDQKRMRARRSAVMNELMREITAGHELHGRIVRVEAFFAATDDVIVRLDDGTFAHVHPTWIGRAERPGYPETTVLGSVQAAKAFMSRWEEWY